MDRKRLAFGRQLSHGRAVFVEVKGASRILPGIVWYKGVLPPCLGTWFGVELFVSTRALVKSCCRSDSNTTELPCMLHRVKLAFTSRESFFNLFNAHLRRRLLRLKGYLNDSFNSM